MSGKIKFPPKPKKSKAGSKKSLESADDFQQAADAEEETGGKWRAGDKAKSCRAFLRAIDIYDQGLTRHPRNFDLAYNKARLQFEVSEQPGLVACLPVSLNEFLQQALQSHRRALQLNEENTDILFNTSQILVSLAENIIEDHDPWELDQSVPTRLLHEALELLDACFARQTMLFEEQQRVWDQATDSAEGGVPLSSSSPSPSVTSQSATVESSVLPSDLLDTLRSSLTALTQLVTLDSPSAIPTLSAIADSILTTKLPYCTSLLPPDTRSAAEAETALQTASFTAARAAADFDAALISSEDYLSRLAIFSALPPSDVEALCTAADATLDAIEAVLAAARRSASAPPASLAPLLARVKDMYAAAVARLSAPPPPAQAGLQLSLVPRVDPETSARVAAAHEAAADAAMVGYVLARASGASDLQALAEAEAGYGAAARAYGGAEDKRAMDKAGVRGMVVGVVEAMGRRDEAAVKGVVGRWKGREELVRRVVREMWDEGLVWEWWEAVLPVGIEGRAL